MTPEAKVKAAVRKLLALHGAYYAMPIGTGYGNSGVPDFLVCVRGHFLAIECKAGKGKTTALQDANLQAIRDAKGTTLVINEHNMNELLEVLQQWKN